MNQLIEEILLTHQVQDQAGIYHPLIDNIDAEEGEYLSTLILSDVTIKSTLEVGCAQGISSLFICDALSGREDTRHVIIDPFQHSHYEGIGLNNLTRAGFDFFELIEELSEFALPVLARSVPASFDMVFIDGWHTFDHTLVDMFYANLLLRRGGYLVIDDCRMLPVSKAVSYFENYPAYRKYPPMKRELRDHSFKRRLTLKTACFLAHPLLHQILPSVLPKAIYDAQLARHKYPSMVALKKVDQDERSWSWYETF